MNLSYSKKAQMILIEDIYQIMTYIPYEDKKSQIAKIREILALLPYCKKILVLLREKTGSKSPGDFDYLFIVEQSWGGGKRKD